MPACQSCGQENPAGFRFCGACGVPLEAPAAGREERKVVSVLFCDLVGFTSRAERLDPEEVRALQAPYFARVRSELERFGGTVEKYIGDAVMAVFGAPTTHEDDPERAVRAALAIRDWGREEGELQVRIAVTTGEALVSMGARTGDGEGLVAGDVVNTAARLQAAAPVNGILVGDTTYHATRSVIEYREHEPVEAKGKERPISVWEPTSARSRLGLDVTPGGRAPLVGRQDELGTLVGSLNRAKRELELQLVTLVGVPGIGKSRLVSELLRHVEAEPDLVVWRQGRSLPYGAAMPMWALGEVVKAHAGILESDTVEIGEEKLAAAVAEAVDADAPWLESHLQALLGLGSADDAGAERRDEAFAAWRRFLEAIAETRPLVVVFEDLHWAHDSLLDFVEHLVEWVEGVPMLIVATARPELLSRRPHWGGGAANAVTLRLSPLSDHETARLVHTLLEQSVLPAELQSTLLGRAEGNPLYAEEFVRMVVERGAGGAGTLPESVQGIIAARLDGLPVEEKLALQDAAVLGKVFWAGAVAATGGRGRDDVEEMLHALARKDFVRRERRSAVDGETEYAFRHSLVRDVAYGQIPRPERIARHERAAAWIEQLGRVDDHAELLAHHYVAALELAQAAGRDTPALQEQARVALRRTGDRAFRLNAFDVAAAAYAQALALWPEDDPERPDLLLASGTALRWSEGGGDEALAAARDLYSAHGDPERAATAELHLADLASDRGRLEEVHDRLESVAALLEGKETSPVFLTLLARKSRLHLLRLELPQAIDLSRQAVPLAEELGAEEARCFALNTIGVARAMLGDRAGVEDLEASIALAQSLNSVPLLIRGYNNLATAAGWLGDAGLERDATEEGLRVASRYGVEGAARFLRGNLPGVLFRRGEWDEALSSATEFLAQVDAGRPSRLEGGWHDVRARIWFARGRTNDALDELEKLLGAAERTAAGSGEWHASAARIYLAANRRSEAERLADGILELVRETPSTVAASDAPLLLVELHRADELRAALDRAPSGHWIELAYRVADGDWAEAAAAFERFGDLAGEADLRLTAARHLTAAGRHAEAAELGTKALDFYRQVGAGRWVAELEALIQAPALTEPRAGTTEQR